MANKVILIAAANPLKDLRLDEEQREIQDALRGARHGDQFEVKSCPATRIDDLRRAMLDHSPHFVHFSGHGTGDDGIVLVNDTGQAQLVKAEALAKFFSFFSEQLECVILNACYSEVQANAIVRQIPYVIGMTVVSRK
jgi:hypothetical protein